jgi:uncharacterized protein (TIGR03086 family)
MSGPAEIWQQAADKFSEVLDQVGDDQWSAPTPCDQWTVRELVDHVLHWQGMGGGILGAGTSAGDDWETIQPALAAALRDPANLEGNAEQFNGMPKHQVAGFVIGDLVIHTWDLARAIGADEQLPADAVDSVIVGLERVPAEMLRGDNMFGPPVDVGDDASPQDKLLAFAGRHP